MKSLMVVLVAGSVLGCAVDGDNLAKKNPHRPDAGIVTMDAGSPAPDAPTTSGGTIACFTGGNPSQTCTAGVPCLFNNYTANHDGYCSSTGTQTYGIERCDGPEDCASGSRCCDVLTDTGDGFLVNISCRTQACPTGAGNFEMCHPTANAWGTCSDVTKHCVTATAAGNYSIAKNLYVCN